MARAHLWWFVALLVVPAALAGIALVWPGRPSAPTEPPAVDTVARPASPVPVVGEEPPSPSRAGPLRAELAQVLATQPIRFQADSAALAGPAAGTVQRVAELLAAAPEVPVVLEGHVADTPGGLEAGRQLSEQRAAVVAEALVTAGVPAGRISTRGLGAERPLSTAEESRRVEITVG